MFIVYTTLVLLNAHLAFCRVEWVDPHDMNIKDSGVIAAPSSSHNYDTSKSNCPTPINFSISHYRRLINLLLSAVAIDRSDLSNFKGRLFINIPLEKYDFLRDFARSNDNTEDPAMLRQVDHILSKILVKPTREHLSELLVSWTDHIYFTFYNRTTGILLACVFVLFISYKLLRANLTIWLVVKYLIFLGWVIDFAFTWINLLQEAEINKMADSLKYGSLPPHCDPNKMNWWQYFVYSVSTTSECREYHQTLYKDHFWSIAPVTVLSHQFGVIIYTPASYIGQALGSFTSGLLGTLPWGINIILLPLLLIFFCIILCIVFSFTTQTSFGFNFLHMIQLNFGNEQRRAVGDVLSGRNVSALVDLVQHRNMIEDVRQNTASVNTKRVECSNCSDAGKSQSENVVVTDKIPILSIKEDQSSIKNADEEKSQIDSMSSQDTVSKEQCFSNNKCVKDDTVTLKELLHDGSGDNA